MSGTTAASAEQELLFALRSPTTPLLDKLALAHSALVASPNSLLLPQLIRDWVLDNLLRARQNQDLLLSVPLWSLFAQAQQQSQPTTTSSSLPVFVAFLAAYSALPQPNDQLLQAVASVWSKLAAGAMRKATVDAALEGYATLLKSSVLVLSRQGEDVVAWQGLAEVWLKAFRAVVDSGKGGKKIPQHTLANLSSLLPLLSLVPATSSLGLSILNTVQFALFNLDNLRRGIARESYNVGVAPSAADDTEGAAGELLGALKSHLAAHPESTSHVLASIPLLTSLYFTSLASYSSTLFPLPAKTTFPTASAARSAGEIHSLQKRRALAAGWVRGVAALMGWRAEAGAMEVEVDQEEEEQKATSLARTLAEVESGDLHREGRNEGWGGILESLVEGSLARLAASPAPPTREATTLILGTILRLSFSSTDTYIPRILTSLTSTPSSPSPASSLLLTSLLTHHSRSLTLPTLLLQLSAALAAPTSTPNSLLTAHEFLRALERALGSLVGGISVRNCWEALVKALVEELPSLAPSPAEEEEEESAEEPSKKKRKVDSTPPSPSAENGASARLRLLALYARSLPSPLPQAQFDRFATDFLAPAIKSLGKNGRKWKAAGRGMRSVEREVLGVGFECRERMRGVGAWEVQGRSESWELGAKRCAELRGLLEIEGGKGEAEVVVVVAQTLLQALELGSPSAIEGAQLILGAILNLIIISPDSATSWDGHLRGLSMDALPVAVWELISRRWLPVFERYASPEQLKSIAELIVGSMTHGASTEKEGITIDGITARLLRRADVYELRNLQAQLHPVLLSRVSLPSLSPSSTVLIHLAASKAPKPLRSLPASSVLSAISTFERITALLPMEYVGKGLRNDLIERALGVDVWISGGKVEELQSGEERSGKQKVLRTFVARAKGVGQSLPQASAVLAHLVKNTDSSSSSTVEVTLDLYRHFVSSAVSSFKSDKNTEQLISYLTAFEKPLGDLSKRFKKGIVGLECEELAFTALCDVLASSLGPVKDIPADLAAAIRASVKAASKPFAKALTAVATSLEAEPSSVFAASDLLNASRSFWSVKDWLEEKGEEHDQVDTYSTFAQQILAALLSQTTGNEAPAKDARTLKTCLAMLDLLAFRIARLRTISDSVKISTVPFETFVACHLAFRQALTSIPGASVALETNLKKASGTASQREYEAALNGVSAAVAGIVGDESVALPQSIDALEPALDVALVLLRDGPEGSSRLSGASLSDLLRHLSLFLLKLSPVSVESKGEQAASAYLLIAKFVEGICADRPMLFSRLNVSSVLSLVARMLQPSGLSAEASSLPSTPTTSITSSALFNSLVSVVAHLVRHRKDHISPLFPHLVSTLSSFLTVLRRSGFGTTGTATSTSADTIEGAEIVISLGRRAEREAKATFPFWAWEGGVEGVGKNEATAVGRLLGSLSAKTTTTLKRKATDDGSTPSTTTVSLVAPLSKHAPFIILPYLRACVHATCPIPSAVRKELQGGWFEVMDAMGKWEREALMKGFLGEDEEAERGVLRAMWKSWEKERYRG